MFKAKLKKLFGVIKSICNHFKGGEKIDISLLNEKFTNNEYVRLASNQQLDEFILVTTVIEILGDDRLVLNVGSNKNVEVGLNFNICRFVNEIFDPETNLSLGILEILQARGVVESVQENVCILKPALKVTEFILCDIPNEKFPFLQTNKQKLTTKEPTSFKNVKVGDVAKCSLYPIS